jgi:hypothetical protein
LAPGWAALAVAFDFAFRFSSSSRQRRCAICRADEGSLFDFRRTTTQPPTIRFFAERTSSHSPAFGRHPEERSDEGPLFDCHHTLNSTAAASFPAADPLAANFAPAYSRNDASPRLLPLLSLPSLLSTDPYRYVSFHRNRHLSILNNRTQPKKGASP